MHIKTSNQPSLKLGFGEYTCNWGTHLCGLYETEVERDEIIFGFLHQGDEDGDLQMYSPTERSEEDFKQKYASLYHDCAHHPDDPSCFQIFSAKNLYYPKGEFSIWVIEEGLQSFFLRSQQGGLRNIRATAEMFWAIEAIPGIDQLMAYESRLNYFIPEKPWISICLYDVSKFSGSIIMNVLRTHPYTINGGVISENPYYQDPDKWLASNAPQFLPQH